MLIYVYIIYSFIFFNYYRNIKNVQKMNQKELDLGLIGKKSWHDQYKDSAWVFIGGLPYDLTEGDVIAVFSQYGFSLISAVWYLLQCLCICQLCFFALVLLNNKNESVPTGVKRGWCESPLPKCMLHCPSQAPLWRSKLYLNIILILSFSQLKGNRTRYTPRSVHIRHGFLQYMLHPQAMFLRYCFICLYDFVCQVFVCLFVCWFLLQYNLFFFFTK